MVSYPPLVDPTAQTHDGFFLRFHLGPAGFATATEDAAGNDISVSGGGGGFALALGGAVARNLIVYGELVSNFAVGPTLELNGQEATASDDVRAGVIGIGPGLAYYTERNLYLSGTLTFAQLSLQEDGEEVAESDTGVGVSLSIGKEWWASPQWGLGLAAQFLYASIPDSGAGDTIWSTAGFMLAFSATLN